MGPRVREDDGELNSSRLSSALSLPGRNWVERADGSVEELTATDSADVGIGDRFIIETPGGGGYGAKS